VHTSGRDVRCDAVVVCGAVSLQKVDILR